MNFHLEKENPYDKKKFSFTKCLKSAVVTVLVFGLTITVSTRLRNEYFLKRAETNYSTAITYYQDMIETTAAFFEENGVDSPTECFELYSKLLWNGYFSNNREYKYDISNQDNVIGYYGLRIATGDGDCKNNEDFFCKLMRRLGYNSYQMACVQTEDKNISLSNLERLMGNHVITVVEHNGVTYYFDATNLCSYEQETVNVLGNDEKELNIYLKPLASYMYGYNDIRETASLVKSQFVTTSGEANVLDESLSATMESSKVLVLRKSLEPTMQQICSYINGG